MKRISLIGIVLICCISFLFAENRKSENEKPSEYEFKTVYYTEDEHVYAGTYQHGFLLSEDNGNTWKERNKGLPRRTVYPFDNGRYRSITSMSVCPGDESRIAVTTSFGLYTSSDRGQTWEDIPLRQPIKTSAYITSVSLFPGDTDRYLIGTSFSGIFETFDSGKTWEKRGEKLDILYRGAGFYEEIAGVAYHPEDEGTIFAACGFGKGLYKTDATGTTIEKITFPNDANRGNGDNENDRNTGTNGNRGNGNSKSSIQGLHVSQSEGTWELLVTTDDALWSYTPGKGGPEGASWKKHDLPPLLRSPQLAAEKTARLETVSNRYGIYIGAHNGDSEEVEEYLDFLVEHDFDTLVIDVKNDRGIVTYNTRLETPKKLGAVYELFDLETLLKKAHDRGIYVIGRQVVFKDNRLYSYLDNKYAIWDTEEDGPWGLRFKVEDEETGEVTYEQREFWVDPYAEFVWEYNAAIAEELEQRGIDEIQFDYIRFPSDGDFSSIQYRHKRGGMRKTEAIESFLTYAGEKLSIPISTDLYGFNSWYRMGNWIGQSIEMISHHVDVVCPMFYPSHFPRSFMEDEPYIERAKKIYREGSARASQLVENRSIVRPYVQAFLIGGEVEFEEPTYTDYLIKQIEGTNDSPASGFTLWNNSNRYYMVTVPLNNYVRASARGAFERKTDKQNGRTEPAETVESVDTEEGSEEALLN